MAVDDPAVTYQAFRDLIVGHLIQKGWKRLLGKRIRSEQSLFEHSLNTLDVVLTYLPIFRPRVVVANLLSGRNSMNVN